MTVRVPRLPFSLDPLMKEAKRRARQRRLLVGLVAVVVLAASAALTVELRGQGSVAPVPANLTVLVVSEQFRGGGGRALFHLKCDPASGDVADSAKACAAIAAQPSLVTSPQPYPTSGPASGPFTVACHSQPLGLCPYSGPDYFRITGSVNGKPVHFSGGGIFATDVALIAKLGLAHRFGKPFGRLEPRRHGFVAMNETRTFAPGVLP